MTTDPDSSIVNMEETLWTSTPTTLYGNILLEHGGRTFRVFGVIVDASLVSRSLIPNEVRRAVDAHCDAIASGLVTEIQRQEIQL